MLPFTQEILKAIRSVEGVPFSVALMQELRHLYISQQFGINLAKQLLNALPRLDSHNFEESYSATVTVVQVLYQLQAQIPAHNFAALQADQGSPTAMGRLYFHTRPAPTEVVVNDWLSEVLWNQPGSLITFSEGEGRFYLVRPNSRGQMSVQIQFLGNGAPLRDMWGQFKAIRERVALAEKLYAEGKSPITRSACMEPFAGW